MFTLVGFGNPLLDICLNVNNNDLLIKYNLQPDDQKEITKDEMKHILDDITRFELNYSPGGCAQNTVRLFQSLQNQRESSCIVGAIGNDNQGRNLKLLVEDNGVVTKYTEISNEPTGTSIALIRGSKRSLVAYLGAAECLSIENINYDVKDLISKGKVFYMEGFFLTKRTSLASLITDELKKQNKIFAFNISAKYLCEGQYCSVVQNMATKSDILFGNLSEYNSLKEACDFQGSLNDYLKHLEENRQRKLTVVTNGANPILVMTMGKFSEYLVPPLDKKLLKDTTGAGDAFVAGFLFAYVIEQPLEMCVKFGCAVAREVIQNIGCSLPKNKSDEILHNYADKFKS